LKKKSALIYFPGGSNQYVHSLRRALTFIQAVGPDNGQLRKWFSTLLGTRSLQLSGRCIDLIKTLELAEKSQNKFSVTAIGRRFLEAQDNNLIYEKLDEKYVGVGDLLVILTEKPLTIDEIMPILKEKKSIKWKTKRQLEIRLNWLISLGVASKIGKTFTWYLKPVAESGTEAESTQPSHSEMQDMIVDLGIMNGFDATKEYKINRDRLDVLWRKRGQTAAWEIHFKGNIQEALAKLKYAFEWLSSELKLITTEDGELEARKLVETTFYEMKDAIAIMTWSDFLELYKATKKSIDHERKLKLKRNMMLREKRTL
jgi:hypothetical protein